MTVHVCDENTSKSLKRILTVLRDRTTPKATFRQFAGLLGDYLVQEAIDCGYLEMENVLVTSPMDCAVSGVQLRKNMRIVAVPILRSGNAFVPSLLRLVDPGMDVAQLVIQRDETTAQARLLLDKTPADIASADLVVVLDPMLATGGSAVSAIRVLLQKGVELEKIVMINGFAAPEGVERVQREFAGIKVVVGVVDERLDEHKYIVPGLGDFGDRFY